ncbi:hypothetical protein BHQ21_08450 [Mycobacterium sherrisii]|uniref:Uncharacterized protein n=1 Tax=Mycobacterium sherrisii TaxID=243061 RepID=A0A1E3T076_9MYCO|nr:hypothetical protein BHQ21_08450 [Mycobacterium sherrisii]
MHGDHWDRATQKRLDHGLPIITTPHAAKRLHYRGFAAGTCGWGVTVTMDRRQGAELAAMLTLPKIIPIHFDDCGVFASPLADFVREMADRGLAQRVIELRRGASVTLRLLRQLPSLGVEDALGDSIRRCRVGQLGRGPAGTRELIEQRVGAGRRCEPNRGSEKHDAADSYLRDHLQASVCSPGVQL